MSTLETNLIQPATGTTLTVGASGDQISAATGAKTSFLYPGFHASKASGDQSLSDDTNTKLTFDTELFDSDNDFATPAFTPTVAGKYYLYAQAYLANDNADIGLIELAIYKNGSLAAFHQHDHRTEMVGYNQIPNIMTIVDANGSSDYFEVYAKADVSSASNLKVYGSADGYTYFGGYRIGT